MPTPRFHELSVASIRPEAEGAVALALAVPPEWRDRFRFEPGQFLTLRAEVAGADLRRSYSICSPRSLLAQRGEIEIGVRAVQGGRFSQWATRALKAGDRLQVLPPEGRFTVRRPRALHRVGFAAGCGITPILSIMASSMQDQPESKFTLVYGNRRMSSVMFNEALQDLKDRYTGRLTLIHILSRQAQEGPLLEGRIDGDKVRAIIDALLPVESMDEVFICGPEGMIEATESALLAAGVPAERLRAERFVSAGTAARPASVDPQASATPQRGHLLEVVLDGKVHSFSIGSEERVLEVALAAGLDLPFSCKAGVCCTCRARVLHGEVRMERNFTLEEWEQKKGFVLTCQAKPRSAKVVISYDER